MNRLNKMIVSLVVSGFLIVSFGVAGLTAEKVSLTMIRHAYSPDEVSSFWQGLIDEWNRKNPDINVTWVQVPYSNFYEKVTASFAAGVPFDIPWCPTWQYPNWKDFLSPAPTEVKQWFLDNEPYQILKDTLIRNEQLIGLPVELSGLSLYYNIGMFEEAGLDRAPVTWTELINFSQKLTKYDASGKMIREGYAIRYAGAAGMLQKWAPFVWSNGGEFLTETEEGWKVAWDDSRVKEAFQLMIDMVYKYKVSSIEFPYPSSAFMDGLAAMHYREPWIISSCREANPSMRVGIAPVVVKEYMTTVYPPNLLTVSEGSPNKKEAWQFIQFLLSPENQAEHAKLQSALGWSKKLTESDPYYAEHPVPYAVTTKDLLYARTEDDFCPNYTEIKEVFCKYLAEALQQEISVGEFLVKAKEEVIKAGLIEK